ncbi:MAG: terminase family protein [Nitrococcus sp.]|nr:terminase family protein [Nitrococcus sp.]
MAEAATVLSPWLPQPGPQTLLMVCPVHEICFGGARGGGKSDGMLGHWLAHQAEAGKHANGILIRRTYPELDEVISRSRELYEPAGAHWIRSRHEWIFPNRARLALRHLDSLDDVSRYIGHSYTWICWEELTHWPDLAAYDRLRASLRTAHSVPTWLLSTCNPGGVGHNAVKERFITPGRPLEKIDDAHGERIFIPAKVSDNKVLLEHDPDYLSRLKQSGPAWLVQAWLEGEWDIAAGAYLEGIWQRERHVVTPFEIPSYWNRWRAMDWGYSAPYAIAWYAQAPDGRIVMYRELYGWGGKANVGTRETAAQVAKKVLSAEEFERAHGLEFRRNPADSSIFDKTGTETSIAEDFRAAGVRWEPAKKGPGSRVNGAHEVVSRLSQGGKHPDFSVFSTCKHFIRTVPTLARSEKVPDDVDTEAEDHMWDQLRYSLMAIRARAHTPPEARTAPAQPAIRQVT